jgi:PTS system mannose-specific IIA component
MIGILVITHGNLGSELIRAAELIKGSLNGTLHISVDAPKGVEDLRSPQPSGRWIRGWAYSC